MRKFLHLKTNTMYNFVCYAQHSDDIKPMVVYHRIIDGTEEIPLVWVRPADEFFDGRFKEIN